jgi:predicted nuclease of predicted toxin-antitoxin system
MALFSKLARPKPLKYGRLLDRGAQQLSKMGLTFDLDFGEIAAYAKGKRAGVVLFRLHNTRAQHVIDRLSRVLADSSAALTEGAIVIVEEGRHRVRRFDES